MGFCNEFALYKPPHLDSVIAGNYQRKMAPPNKMKHRAGARSMRHAIRVSSNIKREQRKEGDMFHYFYKKPKQLNFFSKNYYKYGANDEPCN
jgi:hypothetical protein